MKIQADYDYPETPQPAIARSAKKARQIITEAFNMAKARDDGQVCIHDHDYSDPSQGSTLLYAFTSVGMISGEPQFLVEYQDKHPLAAEMAKIAETQFGAAIMTLDDASA